MQLRVIAQLVGEDGLPIWGSSHEEIHLPDLSKEKEDDLLEIGQKLLDRIDEAKAAVSNQIRVNAGYFKER